MDTKKTSPISQNLNRSRDRDNAHLWDTMLSQG